LKRKIHKTARAERDLIGIWNHSFRHWSEAQADEYLDQLGAGIGVLTENPELGMRRDEVRAGYRLLFIGSHAIYYTVTRTKVLIVRVLHERMDPGRHF
jgi:toxin ParE1/3/4